MKLVKLNGTPVTRKDLAVDTTKQFIIAGLTAVGWSLLLKAAAKKLL